MCGLCGALSLKGGAALEGPVAAMADALEHRGPDDRGAWSSGPAAFGFRRLSILDLSGGHQPMTSPDGRTAIVFNGEIYNHPELKKELEASGVEYRTRSDTETILHLYERDGAGAFERLNGMFAVAIWDGRKKKLVLARDPIGIKPLYYCVDKERLLFSSELKSLLRSGVSKELSPAAVLEYLSFGRVHGPRTALASVMKLPPGHYLTADKDGVRVDRFWSRPELGTAPARFPEAVDRVDELIRASVKRQLLSDVPVGAFLSGGVDSSLVTALMTREAGKVSTFSIGFSGARAGLDESAHARKVSRHLGTDHHELILPADVLDRMEELVPCLDEPIADSAILPTYLLSKFAKEKVKVVLTGEGADELFAGYNRYKAAYLSERLDRLPRLARSLAIPVARRLGKGRLFQSLPYKAVGEWAQALCESPRLAVDAVGRREFFADAATDAFRPYERTPFSLNAALAFDLQTILTDSLLMKVDKTTMRGSLEARVPFLDVELVDYAFRLPASFKMRRLKGKYILRRVAERYLPRDIVWRRKHGFVVPWEEWVRGSKSRAIDDLLASASFRSGGVFDADQLAETRRRLISGRRDADPGLFFRVVIFGLWLESLPR